MKRLSFLNVEGHNLPKKAVLYSDKYISLVRLVRAKTSQMQGYYLCIGKSEKKSDESSIIKTKGQQAIENAFETAKNSTEITDAIINNHKALAIHLHQ